MILYHRLHPRYLPDAFQHFSTFLMDCGRTESGAYAASLWESAKPSTPWKAGVIRSNLLAIINKALEHRPVLRVYLKVPALGHATAKFVRRRNRAWTLEITIRKQDNELVDVREVGTFHRIERPLSNASRAELVGYALHAEPGIPLPEHPVLYHSVVPQTCPPCMRQIDTTFNTVGTYRSPANMRCILRRAFDGRYISPTHLHVPKQLQHMPAISGELFVEYAYYIPHPTTARRVQYATEALSEPITRENRDMIPLDVVAALEHAVVDYRSRRNSLDRLDMLSRL